MPSTIFVVYLYLLVNLVFIIKKKFASDKEGLSDLHLLYGVLHINFIVFYCVLKAI